MQNIFLMLVLFLSSHSYGEELYRYNENPHRDELMRCLGSSYYYSPMFGFGQVNNDHIGNASYTHLGFGWRNPCHMFTGFFIEAQGNSNGHAIGGGVILNSGFIIKQVEFVPRPNSSFKRSHRISMGIHFFIIGIDAGIKIEDNQSGKKKYIPSLGFNFGI